MAYYYVRGGGALAGVGLIIMYCFGMFKPTWYIVHRYDFRGQVLAKMGLFTACGLNSTFQVSDISRNTISKCVNLLEGGMPGWIRAVQFFAILGLFMLCVLALLWLYASTCGNLSEKRTWIILYVFVVVTGILLLIHPIIFACRMRPSEEEIPVKDNFLFDVIVINRLYWGAFILHCIVAGAVNVFSLIGSCCFACGVCTN